MVTCEVVTCEVVTCEVVTCEGVTSSAPLSCVYGHEWYVCVNTLIRSCPIVLHAPNLVSVTCLPIVLGDSLKHTRECTLK